MRIKIVHIVPVLFCLNDLFVQDILAQTSEFIKAEASFDDRQYAEVLRITEEQRQARQLSREEMVKVLELGIRSALELQQLDLVDPYFRQLLQMEPKYQPVAEIVEERYMNYFKKYEPLPAATFTLSMAGCIPWMRSSRSFAVDPNLDYENSKYSTVIWTHSQGRFNFFPWKYHRFAISLSNPDFTYLRTIDAFSGVSADTANPITNLQYREETKTVLLGLNYGWYPIRSSRFGFGVLAGGAISFLRESAGSASVNYAESSTKNNIISARKIRDDARRSNIYYGDLGFEAHTNLGRIGLSMEVHYYRGLNHYNKESERYSDPELVNKYLYTDDDVHSDLFITTLGASYNFLYRVR